MGWLWKILSVEQNSPAGIANWKDLVHSIRVLAIISLLIAGTHFVEGLIAMDFGMFDKVVDGALAGAVLWLEAKKANNS